LINQVPIDVPSNVIYLKIGRRFRGCSMSYKQGQEKKLERKSERECEIQRKR
jgi:hypothetical protein